MIRKRKELVKRNKGDKNNMTIKKRVAKQKQKHNNLGKNRRQDTKMK